MVPVAELRAAIPFGVSMGLRVREAMVISCIGNFVPVPFIILFIRHFFRWLRKKDARFGSMADRLEARAHGKRDLIVRYGVIGLCLFVAIPLPGTGAWTGALIAALMDIRLKKAMPAIAIGIFVAAWIIGLLTFGARELLS